MEVFTTDNEEVISNIPFHLSRENKLQQLVSYCNLNILVRPVEVYSQAKESNLLLTCQLLQAVCYTGVKTDW